MARICLANALSQPDVSADAIAHALQSDRSAIAVVTSEAELASVERAIGGNRELLRRCIRLGEACDQTSSIGAEARIACEGRAARAIAQDPSSIELFALAQRVAATSVSVLISGSSGTGKEVLARVLHEHSARSAAPFVAVNCAAIPDSMLEALLFGHEKGAFTGASGAQPGKFELADGGTLLLDEVTEMPLALQAKLLRVLQEREVERLGARAPKAVDVRVVATSNRDLKQAVADGVFREDLYFRLCVFPLRMPDLAERPGDIPALVSAFVERYSRGGSTPTVSSEAMGALLSHTWPGNVRELENAIQRALVLNTGAPIEVADLMLQPVHRSDADAVLGAGNLDGERSRAERELIVDALRRCNLERRVTAEQLGISERTLRHKLKQFRDRGDDLLAAAAMATKTNASVGESNHV